MSRYKLEGLDKVAQVLDAGNVEFQERVELLCMWWSCACCDFFVGGFGQGLRHSDEVWGRIGKCGKLLMPNDHILHAANNALRIQNFVE